MKEKAVRKVLSVEGMTCASCENRIENTLMKLDGVIQVKAVYSSSNVYVTYDSQIIDIGRITYAIERLGYKVKNGVSGESKAPVEKSDPLEGKTPVSQMVGMGIILVALYVIFSNTLDFTFVPQVSQSMGYGMLFAVGLLTSLHCIAMCGGINLSQCASYKAGGEAGKGAGFKPSLLYNAGRVMSYTVIGGAVGALGSVISFTGTVKGIIAIIAGVFMIIMGINMLNLFPWLRRFNPRLPKALGSMVNSSRGNKGPFIVGVLNGLMPCGPLQAMQLYALGTGSALAGALSMFIFSMGTVPLMFGLGALSTFLGGRFTKKVIKVSAVLVVLLGMVMVGRGLNLSGFNIVAASTTTGNIASVSEGVQFVTTTLESGSYTPIVVQEGIPVRWIIKAEASKLNGCNNAIVIPEYGIEKSLGPGDNIIEFTPDEEGNILYTCWMGMISSNIKVVKDINSTDFSDINNETENITPWEQAPGSTGGGCCGG